MARLGAPIRAPVQVLYAEPKRPLAEALLAELAVQRVQAELILLSDAPDTDTSSPTGAPAVRSAAACGSLVILAEPPQVPWLFETVGRPDRGLQVALDHLYCDWLLPYDSLIRTLSVDYACVHAWRERLLDLLQGTSQLCIQTGPNAELTLVPRAWIAEDGEICAAPNKESIHGTLVVDGAVYDRLPWPPIELHLVAGRVVDPDALKRDDACLCMLYTDLTRDENVAQMAEFGLGINPGACPRAHVMETEMGLGTCYVGLGHNLAYGGSSASMVYTDPGMLRPTSMVDGRMICHRGRYLL